MKQQTRLASPAVSTLAGGAPMFHTMYQQTDNNTDMQCVCMGTHTSWLCRAFYRRALSSVQMHA